MSKGFLGILHNRIHLYPLYLSLNERNHKHECMCNIRIENYNFKHRREVFVPRVTLDNLIMRTRSREYRTVTGVKETYCVC